MILESLSRLKTVGVGEVPSSEDPSLFIFTLHWNTTYNTTPIIYNYRLIIVLTRASDLHTLYRLQIAQEHRIGLQLLRYWIENS